MARKKIDQGGGGGGEWLNTYADMVTLLLTFFILLFSMSSLDSAKFNMLVKAFASDKDSSSKIVINGASVGEEQTGSPPFSDEQIDLQEIYESLKQMIQSSGQSDNVNVTMGEGTILIQFMNDMLFEPNSSVLKPQHREILLFVGNSIKSVQNQCEMISIHGFTAAVPGVDLPVNEWILSAGRADAVLIYFDDVVGVDKTKMTATTWGMNNPIADNSTEEGRSKNRRVEILISSENLLKEQLDNIYEKLVE